MYIANSTNTIKVRHSEDFSPKNLFYLDTSLTLSMTRFLRIWVEFAILASNKLTLIFYQVKIL